LALHLAKAAHRQHDFCGEISLIFEVGDDMLTLQDMFEHVKTVIDLGERFRHKEKARQTEFLGEAIFQFEIGFIVACGNACVNADEDIGILN
jgi:hypothetical protein